jgi:hypothetical protein
VNNANGLVNHGLDDGISEKRVPGFDLEELFPKLGL